MLVGNDVVDLDDPENQPERVHPRWDSRVFTVAEQARVDAAPSPHRTRWGLWAAKESAFKLARKLDADVPFYPRDFVVEVIRDARAIVHHPLGPFDVRVDWAPACVHAVATPLGGPVANTRVGTLRMGAAARANAARRDEEVGSLQSGQVRDLARSTIGRILGLDPRTIDISHGRGVPVATHAGAQLPVDVSLSHHGAYLACAVSDLTGSSAPESLAV